MLATLIESLDRGGEDLHICIRFASMHKSTHVVHVSSFRIGKVAEGATAKVVS